jgi:kynurenine formamidase
LIKTGVATTKMILSTHVGTHIDAPSHMLSGAKNISDFSVDKFYGHGVLIDARGQEEVGSQLLKGAKISEGDVVLVLTKWSEYFGSEKYFSSHPIFTADFAEKLASFKIKMVGMDMPSPDSSPYGIHKILFNAEILIIENLVNIENLLGKKQFQITALPLKVKADGSPARVIAHID